MKVLLVALASGLVFGGGLVLSGMTDPGRILAFLTLNEQWDPSLLLVMGAAVAVHVLVLRLDARRSPAGGSSAPSAKIDRRLVVGAAVFGAGWGVTGYCPGPALVSVGAGQAPAIGFILAMIAGIATYHLWVGSTARTGRVPEAELPRPERSTIVDT